MFAVMTPRARLALLAVAVLAALPSALAPGGVVGDEPAPASTALAGATDRPDPLAATPRRSHSAPAALRSSPLTPVAVAVAAATAGIIGRQRRRQIHGLHSRLADVGDAWRALLLGAPPVLL